MKKPNSLSLLSLALLLSISWSVVQSASLDKAPEASADMFHPKRVTSVPEAPEDKPFAEHAVVFHISSGDGFAQKLVLNNAQNLQRFYGPDKVQIEIVAYGPGLRTLFKENSQFDRIQSMADAGIEFSACANTMRNMGRDTVSLHKAAKVVPGGVVRIMELQEAGWTYIRP
jgi:intracellular sulfur oxidation DsrE/DsrF family protein